MILARYSADMRAARPPDNVAAGRRVPLVADLCQPGRQASVPMAVGADAQGFQIPAVVAVVLRGQLGPQLGGLGRRLCRKASAHSRRTCGERSWPAASQRQHVEPQLASGSQGRDANVGVGVFQRPLEMLAGRGLRSSPAATMPGHASADCRICTASATPARPRLLHARARAVQAR